ncbi:hypothetical protein TNCV_3579671 [Trichonephila clavipes]|nr:hypothetical protein TNCV_3579671 [Trichonephila clavipes]
MIADWVTNIESLRSSAVIGGWNSFDKGVPKVPAPGVTRPINCGMRPADFPRSVKSREIKTDANLIFERQRDIDRADPRARESQNKLSAEIPGVNHIHSPTLLHPSLKLS